MNQEPRLVSVAEQVTGVTAMYLFGSVATGNEHPESDVDVGVLLDRSIYPTERERFECRMLLGTRLADAAGRAADVVILNDAPPQLRREIVVRGRRIFCRDTEAAHALVRDAQLLAADIDPFLQRMRAIALAAAANR